MSKQKQELNLSLSGYDDIFASTLETASAANENRNSVLTNADEETIVQIPLAELHPPEFHPFHVIADDAMTRLAENIKLYGVREPGIVRPRTAGGYELLCGNRRKMACEIADVPTLPAIIRDLDDQSAIITMVDSNIEQRETLL